MSPVTENRAPWRVPVLPVKNARGTAIIMDRCENDGSLFIRISSGYVDELFARISADEEGGSFLPQAWHGDVEITTLDMATSIYRTEASAIDAAVATLRARIAVLTEDLRDMGEDLLRIS